MLLSCAKAKCGTVAQQCASRYAELGADVPTVVPLVTDQTGAPRVDVQVNVDGQPLTSRLDGQALPVDPGLHEFTFGMCSGVFSTQKVMILQGQRNRPIAAVIRAPEVSQHKESPVDSLGAASVQAQAPEAPAPNRNGADKPSPPTDQPVAPRASTSPPPARGGTPALTYVVGGAGLASLGAGALLLYWGRQDNGLLTKCAPLCQPSSVDHVKTLYLAADIAFGAGVAAVGIATWLFATSHAHEAKLTPRPQTYSLDLQPTRSGAYLSVARAF